MRPLLIRHLTAADMGLRAALLRDPHCMRNIGDWSLFVTDEELDARQRAAVADRQDDIRLLCACRTNGDIVGFVWLTELDWRGRSCQLSVALTQRYRMGLGTAAVISAQDYAYHELNMRTVVMRVFEHNTMLNSRDELTRQREVVTPFEGYLVGEFRTQNSWSQSREQFTARVSELPERRAEIRARIRSMTAEVGS